MNTTTSFSDTASQMWATRPPRIPAEQGGNAKIAGVCEGIGVRYQIDPTIVRVLFVVSLFTFGGGLAAYLLAWMCMPRYGLSTAPLTAISRRTEELSPPEKKERTTGWWLLIFFILTFGSFGTEGAWFSSGLLAVGLLFAAWWLLHQRTPQPPAGLLADAPVPAMPTPVDLSGFHPADGTDVPPGRETPPSWDPLGAAPFAWDLPEPGPAPQPARRKPRLWPWVALGLFGALSAATIISGVFGAFLYQKDVGQDLSYTPATEAELQGRYQGEIGSLEVDLRQLPPLDASHTVRIDGGIGPVNVYLPTAVPVQLTCEEGLGELDCDPGTYNDRASGGTLTLQVEGGIGPVKVSVPRDLPAQD
ncbi:MAG: PspC domain-containing protein [Corynebacterium sp.]|uniref:PspC domain-containing protein n=1 Tax=Corynebacterium sp. TaxID=1720 RepID=UPI0026DEC522|nr:PspC domain-containing protein [Corynebacterium sp.]MDO5671022.1 PspC domain-containing protein [Corynebacterium sp.]